VAKPRFWQKSVAPRRAGDIRIDLEASVVG
jgi:hypothetical protein